MNSPRPGPEPQGSTPTDRSSGSPPNPPPVADLDLTDELYDQDATTLDLPVVEMTEATAAQPQDPRGQDYDT